MGDGGGSSGQPRLILVVEDETEVRHSAVAALEAMGFRTLEAENAQNALVLLQQNRDIDLLFTDVRMPGDMDGAELAFTVKSLWPSIGIVVVSAYFDPRSSRLPIGTGFMTKPYRMATLKAAIDQQFDQQLLNRRA